MRRFATALFVPVLMVTAASLSFCLRSSYAAAQSGTWSTSSCKDDEGNTHNTSWWGHQDRLCELRSTTVKLGGQHLEVKSENGGIEVVGEDRGDVAVEARVQAWAKSAADAKDILNKVTIDTSGDRIRDQGPHFLFGSSGYAVNYRVHVPRRLAVDLQSMNGGIDIAHLDGAIHFDTTNGGVSLNDLAGDVHGQTVNGGIEIALTGERWSGQGLRAETTNGGVTLKIPNHYSAHLETGTVNGGIELNFPVTIQGEIKNRLSTNLGSGGPTIHVETTNGGVEINHTDSGGPAV